MVVSGEEEIRTLTPEMFRNSIVMTRLHYFNRAVPVGRVDASSELQWVATDLKQKVVRIGLVVKDRISLRR